MQPYFTRFPQIEYSNTVCLDLTKRAALKGDGRESPYVFYPYTVKNELRSDHVSEFYYNDAELDWLVLLSNDVIDPYYDWYMGEERFSDFIKDKFGSVAKAMKMVKFYRNNWYEDDNILEPSVYENTIDKDWKKYYTPVVAPNFKIFGYKRKEWDVQMNTNRCYQYQVTYNSNTAFTVGEIVDFKNPLEDAQVGTGTIVLANSTAVRVQSVSGNSFANSSVLKVIVGEDSNASVNTATRTLVYENISEGEEVFWSPVYMYEFYQELNEARKNILLIGDGVAPLVVNEVTRKLRSDG